jgi:hypothetical protein
MSSRNDRNQAPDDERATMADVHEPSSLHREHAHALAAHDGVRDRLEEESSSGFRVRRRDLLAWGGAAALYPAFARAARAQAVDEEAATVPLVRQPMSVGFVEGSDTWRNFKRVTTASLNRGVRGAEGEQVSAASVLPATSLIAGDQQLANQVVQVHVHGLYPVPNPLTVKSAYLTIFYPSDNPARHAGPLPFIAWGYKSRPAPDVPAPVKFLAPLGATGELEMQLEVYPGGRSRRGLTDGPLPSGLFTTSFTVDWFEGRPRLQRGLYLLGLTPGTWESQRGLPMSRTGRARPLELLSLMVSFEPVTKQS